MTEFEKYVRNEFKEVAERDRKQSDRLTVIETKLSERSRIGASFATWTSAIFTGVAGVAAVAAIFFSYRAAADSPQASHKSRKFTGTLANASCPLPEEELRGQKDPPALAANWWDED